MQDPQGETMKLSGELDLEEAPKVAAALDALLKKAPGHVAIDLSAVTYMDSSGLGVLIDALRKTKEAGGTLELLSPQPAVLNVLKITRLDQLFQIR